MWTTLRFECSSLLLIFVFTIFVTLINFDCFSRVKIRIMRFFSKMRERVDAFLHDEKLKKKL